MLQLRIVNVTNMSFNAIRENTILAKFLFLINSSSYVTGVSITFQRSNIHPRFNTKFLACLVTSMAYLFKSTMQFHP